ncbi:MAG TPA: pyridoxal phosphate-dependent aminotransferase [Rhizomicrobium sp.]|nr:pyridoxal phosphate-dependent aminotransferase [Rhizomicrobium sp.]
MPKIQSPARSPIRRQILDLPANGIAEVSRLALGEPDLIPLWFGESDLVTPAFIRDAAKKALDDGRTFYVKARGIDPLREAIRAFHGRTAGVDLPLDRITVPGAAMMAVVCALQCVVETGDNVVCISPVWPNIFQATQICGASIKFCRLDEDWKAARWTLDLEKLFAVCDGRTRAIFISSPNNPTGWIMPRAQQVALLEFCRSRGIAIISDEVYGTLVFDGARHAPSFLQVAEDEDDVFVVNGFSKPWAMTGWRLGWLVHPLRLAEQMGILAMANNTGATVFAQYGGIAALSPEGDAFRAQMLARCDNGKRVVERFLGEQNRVHWIPPEGAFYGFLHVEGMKNSLGFAQDLVRTARVGVAPGSAFAPQSDTASDAFIRLCFAQDAKLLETGLERLGKAIASL